jgi:hypothetical protein
MSKRPAEDEQSRYRTAVRDSIGVQLHGTCRAHDAWDCATCTDRRGANEIEDGEAGPIARYCAGHGLPVHVIRSVAEFDAIARTMRGRRN